jgi:hypothetical protein
MGVNTSLYKRRGTRCLHELWYRTRHTGYSTSVKHWISLLALNKTVPIGSFIWVEPMSNLFFATAEISAERGPFAATSGTAGEPCRVVGRLSSTSSGDSVHTSTGIPSPYSASAGPVPVGAKKAPEFSPDVAAWLVPDRVQLYTDEACSQVRDGVTRRGTSQRHYRICLGCRKFILVGSKKGREPTTKAVKATVSTHLRDYCVAYGKNRYKAANLPLPTDAQESVALRQKGRAPATDARPWQDCAAALAAVHGTPLSAFSGPAWLDLVDAIRAAPTAPTTIPARALRDRIIARSTEAVDAQLEAFRGAEVVITHDGWSLRSNAKHRYHGVVVRAVRDGELYEIPAAITQVADGKATSIADCISAVTSKYGLHMIAVVGDNVTVNTAAASLLNAPRVGCFLHQLNLAAKVIVDDDVVSKLNQQLAYVAVPRRFQQYQTECATAGLGTVPLPDRYCSTRFLTTQPIFQWARQVKAVIAPCLSDVQWAHVDAVSVVLTDLHRSMLQSQALTTTTAWALEEVLKYMRWMDGNPDPVAGAPDARTAVDVLRHKAYRNIVDRYHAPPPAQTAAVLHCWADWPRQWQDDFKAVYDGLRVNAGLKGAEDSLDGQIAILRSTGNPNHVLRRMIDHAAAIPASSASQERVFSTLTRTLHPLRRASAPDLVEGRVLLGLHVRTVAGQFNEDRVANGRRSIGPRPNLARVPGCGAAMAQHAQEFVQRERGVWVARDAGNHLEPQSEGPQKRPRRDDADESDDSD